MSRSRRIPLCIAAAAVALAISTSANAVADRPVPSQHVLRTRAWVYDPTNPNTIARAREFDPVWRADEARSDSPRDKNSKLLFAHIPADTRHRSYWAQGDTHASIHKLRRLGRVKNLSFDYYAPRNSPKNWRIPLMFASTYRGIEFHFNPRKCSHRIGSGWRRMDITGFVRNCSFRMRTVDGRLSTFAANGQRSAWKLLVRSHPKLRMFGGGMLYLAPGGYYGVDRLSLSTGYQYNHSSTRARPCLDSERRC
jgi:hypothetical protein